MLRAFAGFEQLSICRGETTMARRVRVLGAGMWSFGAQLLTSWTLQFGTSLSLANFYPKP